MSKARTRSAHVLRPVPASDFAIKWDRARDNCTFRHKSGIGGELSCGNADVVSVFSSGKKFVVGSVNYANRYACIEVFDKSGANEIVFAEPADIHKIFGNKFASSSPKKISERLMKETG